MIHKPLKYLVIAGIALSACQKDKSSSPTPIPELQIPNDKKDPIPEQTTAVKDSLQLAGTWGITIPEKECHVFYTFVPESIENLGIFQTRIICGTINPGEAHMEVHSGTYKIENSRSTRSEITLLRSDSSCDIDSESLKNRIVFKNLEMNQILAINNKNHKQVDEMDLAQRLSKLKIIEGCFISGNIENFCIQGDKSCLNN